MADNGVPKRNKDWAPGTLDATRKAIGDIDEDEAKLMQQKLGGEVMRERIDVKKEADDHKRHIAPARAGQTGGESGAPVDTSSAWGKWGRGDNVLPEIDSHTNSKMDHLMMSDSFGIKSNYGLFNFIRHFKKGGLERVAEQFVSVTLKMFIDNMDAFSVSIKTLIQMASDTYKAKIAGETDARFRLLREVSAWNITAIRSAYSSLIIPPRALVVSDLIDTTRAILKPIVTIYYYGAQRIPTLIKEVYADESGYPNAKRDLLSKTAREAVTQWMYIESEVLYKIYPLVMRMCSDSYEEYVDFYSNKMASILEFAGLKKFDLLMPARNDDGENAPKSSTSTTDMENNEGRDSICDTGLTLLERMFPQAGFKEISENRPDMFPYFQPLYKLDDGFNMLNPENPLQVIVVLIRIIEDCIQGCHNVRLSPMEKTEGGSGKDESVSSIFDDWSAYREVVFGRLYCEPLKSMVNSIYSQNEFETTQFCKKLKTSLLWQTKYHFLPHFKFDQLLLERPQDESKYRPLFIRTDYLRRYLKRVVAECDEAAPTHGVVSMVQNPWDHYKFSIPNEVSKRLDVLLGGKNAAGQPNANNAALLKYMLCLVSVLDWFMNSPMSPAYDAPPMSIFRISDKDGKPEFSVPMRSDQNRLFVESIKARKKKEQK